MTEPGQITRLLCDADRGQADAANRLFALVENELRQIAHKRKRAAGVHREDEVSTTMLVNDAFCRLVGTNAAQWEAGDHRKFFAYASAKIHDLLIDQLRQQQALKRGGNQLRGELNDDIADAGVAVLNQPDVLIDLKDALERLERFSLEDAIIFRLRFFLQCTFEEVGQIMGISKSGAVRSYEQTTVWLRSELKGYNLDA